MSGVIHLPIFLWIALVLVSCGGGGGGGGGTPEQAPQIINVAPVASVGIVQSVSVGTLVTLDGSATDANGDALIFGWTLSTPAGSTSTLSPSTAQRPTFTPDRVGDYIARLIVSDGKANSLEKSVTVTASAANATPIANAGAGQNIVTGAMVTLDATASSDANGDRITYSWTLLSKPTGSLAALNSVILPKPTFIADINGMYTAQVVVNDGKIDSNPSIVTITASALNIPPVANAGAGQNVVIGIFVTLDGSASFDVNGDHLTFSWSLTSKPAGSVAIMRSPTSANPMFIPDISGTYIATLSVNDGQTDSTPTSTVITATTANAAPVANAGIAQTVTSGSNVVLDGTKSSDANGDPITFSWQIVSAPKLSNPTLSSDTVARPTFIADLSGQYVLTMSVMDDKGARSSDSIVTITAETAFAFFNISEAPDDSHDPANSYSTTFSWNSIPGATSYQIFKGILPSGVSMISEHVATTSATTLVKASPCSGLGPAYRVFAYNSSGVIDKSDVVYFIHRMGKMC